jgi:hypothetical protein
MKLLPLTAPLSVSQMVDYMNYSGAAWSDIGKKNPKN